MKYTNVNIFLLLIFLSILSCEEKKRSAVDLSQFQLGAISVSRSFGGECRWGLIDYKNYKIVDLLVSNSFEAEKQKEYHYLTTSNIAYTYFNRVRKQLKSEDKIRVKISFKDGRFLTADYSVDLLNKVAKKIAIINELVSKIKRKEYDSVVSCLKDSVIYKFDSKKVISEMKSSDLKFGDIMESFKMSGFYVKKNKVSGLQLIHFSGYLTRKIRSHQFSIELELNTDNLEVYFIDYRWYKFT